MDAIDAPQAWNAGFTGKGASVFVLDSGIDAEHPDLAPNLNTSLSASFVEGEDWNIREGRFFNHGSHVSGTIAAASNGIGVIGVAYEAELVAVKVLSEFTGSGAFSSINAGIVYAGNNNADVVNMSLGATLNKNGKLIDADGNEFKIPAKFIKEIILAQQRAIDYAFNKGVTIIASAGNDGVNYDGNTAFVKLPGGMNNVITVSATAPEGWNFNPASNYDIPASYTTYGRSLIDVAAPGGDSDVSVLDAIVSTGSTGYYFSSGTSMAAPHVSGTAALIIGKNGKMNPKEVARQIENTSDKIDGNGQSLFFGKGRINAFRAVTE
jgi:subtilisin family serine protease